MRRTCMGPDGRFLTRMDMTPIDKDYNGVISLASAQIKVVEFVPTNLGTCIFHCHVLPHVADDGLNHRGMLTRLNFLKGPP